MFGAGPQLYESVGSRLVIVLDWCKSVWLSCLANDDDPIVDDQFHTYVITVSSERNCLAVRLGHDPLIG